MSQVFLMGISIPELKEMVSQAVRENLHQKPEKNQKANKEFLSRIQVAELLKISLVTLNEWTKQGIVKAYRIGNRVLYDQQEVLSSLQEVRSNKYKRQ